jgi:restriction system protein
MTQLVTSPLPPHVIETAGLPALSPNSVIALMGVVLVVFGGLALYQRMRARRAGIAGVDRMDVKTFEESLISLFRELGYTVEGARTHGDFAAELVIVKDGVRTIVEGKRWGKHIGVNAVQTAITARGDFGCDAAMVVANRPFTNQAKSLAKGNQVTLWDRDALIGRLVKLKGVPAASGPAPLLGAPENGAATAPAAVSFADDGAPAVASGPALATIQMAATSAPPAPAATADGTDHLASCALCGVTVHKDERVLCLSQPARFGGRVYCRAHQDLFAAPSS